MLPFPPVHRDPLTEGFNEVVNEYRITFQVYFESQSAYRQSGYSA